MVAVVVVVLALLGLVVPGAKALRLACVDGNRQAHASSERGLSGALSWLAGCLVTAQRCVSAPYSNYPGIVAPRLEKAGCGEGVNSTHTHTITHTHTS